VRLLEHSLTDHTGSMTPVYAAPEFFNRQTSNQSDQYCLAVTYCHMRGGRLPFTGSFADIMAGHLMRDPDLTMLPAAEQPVVAQALAKEPKNRWPNCRTFIETLALKGTKKPVPDTKTLFPSVTTKPTSLARLRFDGYYIEGGGEVRHCFRFYADGTVVIASVAATRQLSPEDVKAIGSWLKVGSANVVCGSHIVNGETVEIYITYGLKVTPESTVVYRGNITDNNININYHIYSNKSPQFIAIFYED
jgi:hypothetical protein